MGIWDDSVLTALTFQPKKPFANQIYYALKETLLFGDISIISNAHATFFDICIIFPGVIEENIIPENWS